MAVPLRVLAVGSVYPPHHLGGYEIIWRGAMRHLRQEGHLARILTTGYRRPEAGPGAAEDPDVHRELDWYWRDHEWRPLGPVASYRLERRNAGILDRHLEEFRPDVITWWPVGGMSLGLIERARRTGIPSLLFVLDPWLSYAPVHDRWQRLWAHLGPAARLADRLTGLPTGVDYPAAGRWVFCSATMRAQTLAAGLESAQTTVLTPGVERAFLDLAREPETPPWRWRLLYLGRVVEQKGVATAVESLALLPAGATLRILGAGDAAYRQRLERLAARLEVNVAFEPPRPREELPGVYREADAVVFPVEWPEPWGLVPLEAMALGRPVVATGRGGSGEYLRHGENALIFDAGSPAGLAAALRALAGDAELRDRLRRGGYETAARHGEDAFNAGALAEMRAAVGRSR
ncbi:MAG TPA: glycosyltransferase [Solirubrobacteraceae bacterium]|nr:glycosyltransferase [Solirubrobacteraceae bacterium]